MTVALLFILGAFTGIVSGYLGIGGGVIIVPILSEMFMQRGMDVDHVMTSAFATSLLTVVFTTGASAWKQWRQDNLILNAIPWTVSGAILGGQLGAWLGSRLAGSTLMLLFGFFLLFAAVNLAATGSSAVSKGEQRRLHGGLILLGFVTGVMAALFGVGGGILMVPGLIILFRFPAGKVAGTSSAIACLIAISGVIGYVFYGSLRASDLDGFWGVFDLKFALPVAAGAVLTARFGARLNKQFGGAVYRRVFAVFLVVIAVRMLLRSG